MASLVRAVSAVSARVFIGGALAALSSCASDAGPGGTAAQPGAGGNAGGASPATGGVVGASGAAVGGASGGPGSGGAAASGGAAGSQGTGGSGGEFSFPGSTIEPCPNENPPKIPYDGFPECEVVGCVSAHCVPVGAVPEGVPRELLGECDDASVCIPDDYITTYGRFLAKTCESILGAEGRCISTCIPQVNGLMDALPQDVCGENERCAPCINPNDGTETGACAQGCDEGALPETVSDPIVFEECAMGAGVCTPKSIIPEVLLTQLPQDVCPSAEYVCSPKKKAQNLKYNFPACEPGISSLLAPPTDNGQWGGCVPTYLADANPIEGIFLAQMTCDVGEKCAPCINPFRNLLPTGACPVPLPSDESGGMLPEGGSYTSMGGAAGVGGAAGTGGVSAAGGATAAGGAAATGGAVGAGGAL